MKLRIIISTIAFLAFFSISLGMVIFFNSLRDKTYDEAASRSEELVHDIVHDIDLHIREHTGILGFISRQEEFKKALISNDAETLSRANNQLDRICTIMEAMDVCYLIDINGNTIASSNRNSPDSFVGKNYSFRPYFRQAVSGVPAVYAALGVTSKKRGLYYAYPVYGDKDKRPSGVIVIKENIEHLRKVIVKSYEGVMMITGPNGVVFFSNREGWLYKTLWEVTPEQTLEIKESKQFGDGPWEWSGVKRTEENHAVDTVGREYHIHQKELRNMPEWQIVYLHEHEKEIGSIEEAVLNKTGFLFLAITIFFGLFILYLLRTASLDMALRKKAALELKKSEERLRDITFSMSDWVWEVDENGVYTYSSQKSFDLLGASSEDVIGKTPFDFMPPDEAKRVAAIFSEIAANKAPIKDMENWNIRKNGEIFCLLTNGVPILDEAGNLQGYRGVDKDITERKKAEEERDRLNEQIKERNKELQQIVYTASHDLRSPLINIQGYSRLLVQYLQQVVSALRDESVAKEVRDKAASILDKDIPESAEYINASVAKMDSLLSAMLRLSRSASADLQIEKLDMDRIVSDVLNAFNFQIKEAGAKVEVSPLPSCSGDKTQINQVFSNLIGNAIKFLSPERPGVIKVTGSKEDGQIIYSVEDNGIGIPAGEQEKIFEIFHRVNPEDGTGEGIGLSIVNKIIGRHSGKVWVESEVEKGSKFYVELPVGEG